MNCGGWWYVMVGMAASGALIASLAVAHIAWSDWRYYRRRGRHRPR